MGWSRLSLNPQEILLDCSQNCFSFSLPTPSPFFSYKSTSASSCVLWKPHCLSDEQVLTETWTRSQITMSLKQKFLDSLMDSFYHHTIQVSIPAISTSVSLLPGQISLGFLLVQLVFIFPIRKMDTNLTKEKQISKYALVIGWLLSSIFLYESTSLLSSSSKQVTINECLYALSCAILQTQRGRHHYPHST